MLGAESIRLGFHSYFLKKMRHIRLKDVMEKIADDASQALEDAFGGEGSETTVVSLLQSMAANGINLVRDRIDGQILASYICTYTCVFM